MIACEVVGLVAENIVETEGAWRGGDAAVDEVRPEEDSPSLSVDLGPVIGQ